MAFGAHDVQPAKRHYFIVFEIGLRLGFAIELFPTRARHTIELAQVVEVIKLVVAEKSLLAFGQHFDQFLAQALLLGHELGVAAQQNVGTAAGHVG